MARPTKFNKALSTSLCSYLAQGYTIKDSTAVCGISYDSFNLWLKMGEAATEGPYYEFSQAVKEARAKALMGYLDVIKKARDESWQAAAWYLERSDPEHWARKDAVSVDAKHSGKVEIVFKDVDGGEK